MSPTPSCTLTLSGLDVAFGARTLFSGLDLTLAHGDVTAVVGPNGSGKSTLMRTIVGDLSGEAGEGLRAPKATLRSLTRRVVGMGVLRGVEAAGGGSGQVHVTQARP